MGPLARRRRVAAVLAAALVVLPVACGDEGERVGSEHAKKPTQPYAGLEKRKIKALPPERVADLLAGRGAGYALAAELNHYPGPAHVLELERRLQLTRKQAGAMRRIEARVHERAKPLGRQLVELERELERAFRSGTATRAEIAQLTGEIGRVEGRVRLTHLEGHLETRKLLSRHQVMRYDQLRGYGSGRHGHEPMHDDR